MILRGVQIIFQARGNNLSTKRRVILNKAPNEEKLLVKHNVHVVHDY
jgi:hypothetical protein